MPDAATNAKPADLTKAPELPKPLAPKGEHIFPATILEPLAVRWKELVAQKREDEAMELLEQIVVLCTPMFIRLAQHEGFHHTVDIETLTLSAQSRVANWLLYWDPKKGKLFSWASKSLAGNSMVLLADGTEKRIDEIVENKLQVDVVSWNVHKKCFVNGKITDWIKSATEKPPLRRPNGIKYAENDQWRLLSVRHPNNERGAQLLVTGDHPVLTQRGWVEVDYLVAGDTLFRKTTQLTQSGIEAINGMYLGDGCIVFDKRASGFGATHGERDPLYSKFCADQLKCNYREGSQTYTHKGKSRPYAVAAFGLNFLHYWPDFDQSWLPHKKIVTPWVLSHLTPIALAYWYMDDGSLKWYPHNGKVYGVSLATESFSRSDVKLLMDQLEHKFGIKCEFYKRLWADYGSIHIKKDEAIKFLDLVAPHIPEIMRRKLPYGHHKIKFCPAEMAYDKLIACDWELKPAYRSSENEKKGIRLDFKYDITIAGTRNFVANGIVVHNCSKHVFLAEVVRASQHRRRFYPTSDNLEKFVGTEDNQVSKHEAIESITTALKELHSRWADTQALDCIRYHLACIVENPRGNKKAAIRGGSYASGLSLDMSKFFYNWALFALRDSMYDQLSKPYTEQDLFRLKYSFTYLPDMLTIVSWQQMLKIIALLGGNRIKLPTMSQLQQAKKDYHLFRRIDREGDTPLAVEKIAAEEGVSPASAEETYAKLTHELNDDHADEVAIYD
jgi:hypothetical protein